MPVIEERVDTLESLLGQFIIHTDVALRRLENEMRGFKDEMRGFKDESEKDRKRMNKQLGELANKMGTIVEDIVAPNITRVAEEYFGCGDLEDFMIRRKKKHSKDKSKIREFDVIAVCNDKVILNETKATIRSEYIKDFIDFFKNEEFYEYFPEYKGKELIAIFSSLYISDDIVQVLSRSSIYAMGMKDDTMDLLNFKEVKMRQ
jgi:hypothetical protein